MRLHLLKIAGLVAAAVLLLVTPSTTKAVPGDRVGLQATFAPRDGKPAIDQDSASDGGRAVTRLADGRYLAFANTTVKHLVTNHPNPTYLLDEINLLKIVRYSPSGRRDHAFDSSDVGRGVRVGGASEFWKFGEIIRYSSTRYLAWAGTPSEGSVNTNPRFAAIIFNPETGKILRSFGSRGILRFGKDSSLTDGGFVTTRAVKVLSNGRILACGRYDHSYPNGRPLTEPFAVSFTPSSTTPGTFFGSGSKYFDLQLTNPGLNYGDCRAMAQLQDGRVVMAGGQSVDGFGDTQLPWVGMFSAEGNPDLTFGKGGVFILPDAQIESKSDGFYSRVVVPSIDGKIYIAGTANQGKSVGFVARLTSTGELDKSFAGDGFVTLQSLTVNDLSVGTDGNLLISGTKGRAGGRPVIGRLRPDGAWDPNFYGRGYRTIDSYADRFYQLSTGNSVQLWGAAPTDSYQGVMQLDTVTKLDSSITSATTKAGGVVRVQGNASSPDGLMRVEVSVAPDGTLPTKWTPAGGTYRWIASFRAPKSKRSLIVYSRAVSAGGVTEMGASTKSGNQRTVR